MDPTEEACVAQVREASIAQVTHVKAKAQRASRGARRQLKLLPPVIRVKIVCSYRFLVISQTAEV